MPQGTIKKLVADRGFGFIAGNDGDDVFFHFSVLAGIQFEELAEGTAIEYELEESDGGGRRGSKGPRASSVKLSE